MRRPRRALAAALAVALLATLSAASCAPNKTPQPQTAPTDDVSYEDVPVTQNPTEDPHDRQNVVPVPKGTSPRGVEFADPNTGYALFTNCVAGAACQAGLVLTLDGGSSWVERKLPFDNAIDIDLHLGRGNVLIIKAAPDGYFVSKDTGRTWDRRPLSPPPVELNLADPQYSVGCQDTTASGCADAQPWIVADDGSRHALPARPPGSFKFLGLTAAASGALWLTAEPAAPPATPAAGTAISVWSSNDKGRTWQAQGTAHASDADAAVKPVVAPDGSDIWLLGPHFAARRQTGTTGSGSAWLEATAMREVNELFNAEVLPGGAVLIASSQGVWVLDQQQRVRDVGARLIFRLKRLDATTILGYPAQLSGEVWICTVKSKACDWAHVAVSSR